MLFFPVWLLSYAIGVVFHEAGHWIVGVAVGFRIQSVRVGAGPVAFLGRVGHTTIDLRWLPVNGLVLTYPLVEPTRASLVAFYLGGVLGNLVLIAIAAAFAASPAGELMEVIGPGFIMAQVYLIGLTLIPLSTARGGTDGLRTLRALRRGPDPAVAASTLAYRARLVPYAGETEPRVSRAAPCIIAGMGNIDKGVGLAAAVQVLMRELDRREATRAERLLIIDMLITREIIDRDLDLGARLDDLARLAARLGPDIPTLRGSRGAALVEMGRFAEGKPLLVPLAAGPPSFDAIISQLFLARAEHAMSASGEAQRLLEAARAGIALHPSDKALDCLARSEAIVSGSETVPAEE